MIKRTIKNIPLLPIAICKFKQFKKKRQFLQQLAKADPLNLVIGSAGIYETGWIPSEAYFLNLLKPNDWQYYFKNKKINAIMAEHVWEHLTIEQGLIAAKQCFKYLMPGGYLRIAVPDGYHPDPEYIRHVEVGGTGPGSCDHKVLYTYQTLQQLFFKAGFVVTLLEYFDENGNFHYTPWDPILGKIHRSKRFDERNNKTLRYTSIILDAHKATKCF